MQVSKSLQNCLNKMSSALQEVGIESTQQRDCLLVSEKELVLLQLSPTQIGDRTYCQSWSVYDPSLLEAGLSIKETVKLLKSVLKSAKKGTYQQLQDVLNEMSTLLQEFGVEHTLDRDMLKVRRVSDDELFIVTPRVTAHGHVHSWEVHGLHLENYRDNHTNMSMSESAKLIKKILDEKS